MTEFDSFATQLLDESKALLDKARSSENFTQTTYLHSSLLLAISALEACLNSIIDELLVDPYLDKYSIQEQALLLEKEVSFDRGEFSLSNKLKVTRMTDRIEFLFFKFANRKIDGSLNWYANLKQSIELRNKLVHPKENLNIAINQVEQAIISVIETINEIYLVVYHKKYPSYDRGLFAKNTL